MIGIVIVAHGGLAGEYLSAVEHVVGKQTGVLAIPIEPDHDRDAKQAEICAAADSVDAGVRFDVGGFDTAHADIVHDAANPDRPRTAFGAMVAALRRRREPGRGTSGARKPVSRPWRNRPPNSG